MQTPSCSSDMVSNRKIDKRLLGVRVNPQKSKLTPQNDINLYTRCESNALELSFAVS